MQEQKKEVKTTIFGVCPKCNGLIRTELVLSTELLQQEERAKEAAEAGKSE